MSSTPVIPGDEVMRMGKVMDGQENGGVKWNTHFYGGYGGAYSSSHLWLIAGISSFLRKLT